MMDLDIVEYGVEGYKINGEKYTKIRSMVMGIVKNGDKVLLTEHFSKEIPFYRCIGGGIEFYEKSEAALKREFMEEINEEIIIKKYLGLAENLFIHKGKKGHEMVLLYEVELDDNNFKKEYPILDSDVTAIWVNINDIILGRKVVYPEIVKDFIKELNEK